MMQLLVSRNILWLSKLWLGSF